MLYVAARIATINQECKNTACPPGSARAASLTGLFGLTNLSIYLTIIVLFLPLLTGVFLGAPLLAREHEQRTLLLAWSQDITPQRWLWTKFALLGVLFIDLLVTYQVHWAIAVLLMVAGGMILGSIHGFLVTRMRMQPFVVTLCGLLIYRGVARYITGVTLPVDGGFLSY